MKTAEQLAEEKYPETSDNRIRRAISSEKRKAFIEGYNTDKWISVEEGPEFGEQVLVFNPQAVVKMYTVFYMPWSTTEQPGIFTNDGSCPEIGVTHWQPLPSPPKQNNQV